MGDHAIATTTVDQNDILLDPRSIVSTGLNHGNEDSDIESVQETLAKPKRKRPIQHEEQNSEGEEEEASVEKPKKKKDTNQKKKKPTATKKSTQNPLVINTKTTLNPPLTPINRQDTCLIIGPADASPIEFQLTINQPSALKHMVQMLAGVLKTCSFNVVNTGSFSGISTQNVDDNHSCFIIARLNCQVTMEEPDLTQDSFCVNINEFCSCLNTVESNSCLKISKRKDDATIYCDTYEPKSGIQSGGFKIKTNVFDEEGGVLKTMNHLYTITISLEVLKKSVKTAKDLQADDIEFTVMEPKEQDDQETISDSSKPKHIFVKITVNGKNATVFKIYHSVTVCEPGDDQIMAVDANGEPTGEFQKSYVVKTIEEEANDPALLTSLVQKYNGLYTADRINKFIKCMQRTNLSISLSPGFPMIIHYALGNEQSYMRFVLTEKLEDTVD